MGQLQPLPHTPAAPGASCHHQTDARDVDELYRNSLKAECERREFALRLGISTVPAVAALTTGLGVFLGLSGMGIALLGIIGLSCGPGLALGTLTAHKVLKGRKLKQAVVQQARQMGLSEHKASFLWQAVCLELDAIDRESLSTGNAKGLFKTKRHQRFQKAISDGRVPWELQSMDTKSLPGV